MWLKGHHPDASSNESRSKCHGPGGRDYAFFGEPSCLFIGCDRGRIFHPPVVTLSIYLNFFPDLFFQIQVFVTEDVFFIEFALLICYRRGGDLRTNRSKMFSNILLMHMMRCSVRVVRVIKTGETN